MDKISEPSSKGKKRQRDQQDTQPQTSDLHQTLSLGKYTFFFFLYIYIYIFSFNLKYNFASLINPEENFAFSDTLVALRMMRAQFPRIDKVRFHNFP
jgi:hypothetical protein